MAMRDSEFTLKAMPPRLPRAALERARLQREWIRVHDRTAIVVAAPAGFGKTTLLLQWRRRWMEEGALVAWLDADEEDEPERFTMALLHSLCTATGRPVDRIAVPRVEALTNLLCTVATRGTQTVLIVDEADCLPEATVRTVLQYLLMNAPANLHVVVGTRVPLPLQTAELAAKGNHAAFGTEDLRLRVEEAMEILDRRLGERLGTDDRARLHDATEGWPSGLQLAIAAIEQEPDLAAAVRSLSARHGTLQDYFVESLVSRLPAALVAFLTHIAILDPVSPALCEAVTLDAKAGSYLEWLARETPILMVGERPDCLRLHTLARDFLRGRFEQLPAAEQAAAHGRASRWYAAEGRFHEAALHALAAGDEQQAETHAAHSLWELGTSGQLAEAREWLARLPTSLFAGDTGLRLAAASILAFSDRNSEALRIARNVLADTASAPESRSIALRIAAGANAFADGLDDIPDLLPRWPALGEPGGAPLYTVACLNTRALLALHAGETVQTRELIAEAATHGRAGPLRLAAGLGQMLVGLSHLWDGDAYRAEAVLRPALALAERDEGRRSLRACLLAAPLAQALLQRDQPEAARALLADRVDVLERGGFADTLWCTYRTLSRIALGHGDERRALAVLDDLCALAERRRLPRLRLYALCEQVRIHALRGRIETIAALMESVAQLAPVFGQAPMRWFLPQYRVAVAIAAAHAAIARRDFADAERQLTTADELAGQLRRGHDMLTIKVLRAIVARQGDAEHALPLLAEALSLAQLSGHERLLANAPASATELVEELRATPAGRQLLGASSTPRPPAMLRAPSRNALLTSKESEILELLRKGMSNKQIARTLDVSGETVKWHLKNLFLKLSAGNRKHAVDRACLLGIVH